MPPHALVVPVAKSALAGLIPSIVVSIVMGAASGGFTAAMVSPGGDAPAHIQAAPAAAPAAPAVTPVVAPPEAGKPVTTPLADAKPAPRKKGGGCKDKDSKCRHRCATSAVDCKSRCWFKFNGNSNDPGEKDCEYACDEHKISCESNCRDALSSCEGG